MIKRIIKRVIALATAGALSHMITVPFVKWEISAVNLSQDAVLHKCSIEDLKATQAFILNAPYNGNGRVIDADEDGRIDCFDMVMLRKMYLEQTQKTGGFYSLSSEMVNDNDAKYGTMIMSDEFYSKRVIVKSNTSYNFSDFSPKEVINGPNNLYVLQFETVENAELSMNALRKDEHIEYVELDEYMSCGEIESERANANSWGVSAIEADKYSEYLSNNYDSSVVVAVVDTGVASHDLLKGRILDNGYDLVDNDPDPNDKHYHGTHVAGTVVDCTPDLNINIMPVRVLNENGCGSNLNVGNGIRYAAENGADIINLSLGGEGCSKYIDDSIAYAVENGVTVVVAAGNDGDNTVHYCPSHLDDCIVVGACDSNLNKANFSNYGNSIDVTAPGVNIKSCIPGGSYKQLNGTSMATPHIAAAAAMIKYADKNATPAEIEQKIKDISLDLGDVGKDVYYGYGLPKLSKLIENDSPDVPIIDSGKCGDDVYYTLDENGLLTISGTGDMTDFYNSDNAPWYEYRENIKKVIIENGVTNIGSHAFVDCSVLESINIQNSVTSIGEFAFHSCSALTSINIPNSVTIIEDLAFYNCSSLISVTIPDSVTSIGDWAFDWCSSLISVTIPNSVTSIGDWAFANCLDLTSINIPDSVTSIGAYAIAGCSALTSTIAIPDSVTNIGDGAFSSCDNLTEINVSENNNNYMSENGVLFNKSKTTLMAYLAGKKDTEYIIPNSVSSIGGGAFADCSTLKSINIPDSVTSIGGSAFHSCSALTSINIPDSVTSIGDRAFCNCYALKSINIPDSVTSIEDLAFCGCYDLTSITIPDSVTSIRTWAFYRCEKLEIKILNTECKIDNSEYTISNTSTIYGYKNSTAQAYAEKYNRTFVAID